MYHRFLQICVFAGSFAVLGCAGTGGGPIFGGAKPATATTAPIETEFEAAPAVKPTPVVKVKPKPKPKPPAPKVEREVVEVDPPAASTSMDISVIYFERILVPEGSSLTESAVGPNGSHTVTEKTGASPPYLVKMTVPGSVGFPLTLKATLTSLTSQVFAGEVEVPAAPADTVKLMISPQI